MPGNHEFYRADRQEALAAMRTDARKYGIHLLDNDEVVIGGPTGLPVRFLGATLWTDFELDGSSDKDKAWAMMEGQHFLNDFRAIRDGDGRFTPARSVELHNESVEWLEAKLDEPFDGKTVVVTHHLSCRSRSSTSIRRLIRASRHIWIGYSARRICGSTGTRITTATT